MGSTGQTAPRLDALSASAVKVVQLIEQRMLDGDGPIDIHTWATTELGLSSDQIETFKRVIWDAWSHGQTYAARDEIRAKMNNVYRKAIETWQHAMSQDNVKAAATAIGTAQDVLSDIAKLDGLNVASKVDLTVNGNQPITNATRETVVQLMTRMRELATQKNPPGVSTQPVLPLVKPNGSNGSNGHSLAKAIDVSSTEKILVKSKSMTVTCLDCRATRSRDHANEACPCGSIRWRAFNPDLDD